MPVIIRPLDSADVEQVQALLARSPEYTRRVRGRGVLPDDEDVRGNWAARCRPGMNHVALTAPDRTALDAIRSDAAEHGWRELFGAAYPHAGGPEHTAWYGEAPDGVEVELVAPAEAQSFVRGA